MVPDLKERYLAEEAMLMAWGDYVTHRVTGAVHKGIEGHEAQPFFVIPPVPRTKTVDSLIEKAYFRRKGYQNPYDDITDKVGTRFVVLLLRHARQVANALEADSSWIYSLDRDFERERLERPSAFVYQSRHYVVRPVHDISWAGQVIPEGTPCEVQIRTLLQHAVSELTHDAVYKNEGNASPRIHRAVARSIALIEATDDLFEAVDKELSEATAVVDTWVEKLTSLYREMLGHTDPNHRLNSFLVDVLTAELKNVSPDDLASALAGLPMTSFVAERSEHHFLYRQPVILLVFYLATTRPYRLRQVWPLTLTELEPVYSDLGASMPD